MKMIVSDQEYLKREIVEAEYTITDEKIKIQNSHTGYIDVANDLQFIEKKNFEDLFKEVKKLCRNQKIKLANQKMFKENMVSWYEDYCTGFNESKKKFEEMKEIALQIEKRKLHYGTADDILLKELYERRREFEKVNSYDTGLSKFKSGYNKLKDLVSMLENNEEDIQMLGL